MKEANYHVNVCGEEFIIKLSNDSTTQVLLKELARRIIIKESSIILTDNKAVKLELSQKAPLKCVAICNIKFVRTDRFPTLNTRIAFGKEKVMLGHAFSVLKQLSQPPFITRVYPSSHSGRLAVSSDAKMLEYLVDEHLFTKKVDEETKLLGALREVLGDGILTTTSDHHSYGQSRKILNQVFSPLALEKYSKILQESFEECTSFFDRHATFGTNFEISRTIRRFTLQSIERITIGGGSQYFKNMPKRNGVPEAQLADTVQWLLEQTRRRTFFPQILQSKEWTETVKKLREEYIGVVRRRRTSTKSHNDILQHCLEAKKDDGSSLSDEEIRDHILTIIAAATDTTATSLTSILFLLSLNTPVQDKLYQDIIKNGWEKSTYLEWTILEGIRHLPPAPGVHKRARNKCAIPCSDLDENERLIVEPNDGIFTNFLGMAFNERYWSKDANLFYPERWCQEERQKRHPYCDAFFSSGTRSCIGRILAMKEMKIFVSGIILRYVLNPITIQPKYTINVLWQHKDVRVELKHRSVFYRIPSTTLAPQQSTKPDAHPSEQNTNSTKQFTFRKVHIAYGSETGYCESLARNLWLALNARFRFQFLGLSTLDAIVNKDMSSSLVVVITSTCNGLPPSNAKEFAASRYSLSLRESYFACFGSGSREWRSTFHKFPKAVWNKLCESQGKPLLPLCCGDHEDGIEDTWEDWKKKLIGFISPNALVNYMPLTRTDAILRELPCHTHKAPALQRIHSIRRWNEGKVIDLQVEFQAFFKEGDSVSVRPFNSEEKVKKLLTILQLGNTDMQKIIEIRGRQCRMRSASESISFALSPVSLQEALMFHVDIMAPVDKAFLKRLEEYDIEFERRSLEPKTILDLISSVRMNLETLLNICDAQRPRMFSIASRPNSSRQIRLLMSRKEMGYVSKYCVDSGYVHASVQSSRFGERIAAGQWDKPYVMFATGTGIAPFLSFLERRKLDYLESEIGMAKCHFVFGCTGEDSLLCKDQLQDYLKTGVIDSLTLCFSKQQEQEIKHKYVTDYIQDDCENLASLCLQGAYFYVCGQVKSIAESFEMVAKLVGVTVDELRSTGHYMEDIWHC